MIIAIYKLNEMNGCKEEKFAFKFGWLQCNYYINE